MNRIATIASLMLMSAASLCALSGCDGEASGEPEQLGTEGEPITKSCTQSGADATWTSHGSSSFTSSQYGAYCTNTVVVDVTNLQVLRPANAGAGVSISWNDTVPNTKAACDALVIAVDLFNWTAPNWVYNNYTPYISHGTWTTFDGSSYYCQPPTVEFPTATGSLIDGQSYRFEAEALTCTPVWSTDAPWTCTQNDQCCSGSCVSGKCASGVFQPSLRGVSLASSDGIQ
jgi:hypothetical protein